MEETSVQNLFGVILRDKKYQCCLILKSYNNVLFIYFSCQDLISNSKVKLMEYLDILLIAFKTCLLNVSMESSQ